PRPIVLRANVGDVLEIRFSNLLVDTPPAPNSTWTAKPFAGIHVAGLNLENNITDDSSYVGQNVNSFASNPPSTGQPQTQIYRYFAAAEGVFELASTADPSSTSEIGNGLFGCVIVQPPQAEYYRSQVTRSDLFYATLDSLNLPKNQLLHKKPDPNPEEEWVLTTFKSRDQSHPLKNVDVVLKQPAQKLGTVAPAAPKTSLLLERNERTGTIKSTTATANAEDQERGKQMTEGYLHSAMTGHPPIIDYSSTYGPGQPRPAGWPILRMLFPVAKGLLLADGTLGEAPTGTLFQTLSPNPDEYRREIDELDNSVLPERLKGVLKNWGIYVSDVTAVAPERSYICAPEINAALKANSGLSGLQFPGPNYIWLLTGVTVNNETNATVIIQGDVSDEAHAKIFFLGAELQFLHSDSNAIIH